MKKLKKNLLLLIISLLVVTVVIIWTADAPNRKTKAFLARYEITDLTALGFQNVIAINDKGQVLGYDNQGRICIWDKQDGLIVLNIPKVPNCDPVTFNNSGQVAGSFQTPNRQMHTFIWDANNGLIDLGTLGGTTTRVHAINDSGYVVGTSKDPNRQWHPFFWNPNTGMTDLYHSTHNQDRIRYAFGINKAGRVVGSAFNGSTHYPIIWDRESGFVRLPTPNNASGVAYSVSSDGKSAGQLEGNGNLIIWNTQNNYRDLGTLRKNAHHIPMNINDTGQIVGNAFHRGILSSNMLAFFWSNETGFIILEELRVSKGRLTLPQLPWLSRPKSNHLSALDINNKGQILKVTAPHGGLYTAILMTPKKIPE
jgi:probable HAF family extracellular repeat protein